MSKGKQTTSTITVQGIDIKINQESFMSMTDIARKVGEPKTMIQNWMRTRNTVEFLGIWEIINNEDFNSIEYDALKNDSGSNAFTLSPKRWIETVNAKGMTSKAGKGGGTFAHTEIALEFASWLNPAFKLLVFKEFNRLKQEENKRKNKELNWNVHRIISKANFHIHSEAVKKHLIPPRIKNTKAEGYVFASEYDLINIALFGMTAKQWRVQNPELKGNIRDNADAEQLLVLSNLQSLNAKLMEWGSDQEQRLDILNKTAIEQMEILTMNATLKKLPKPPKGLKSGKKE